MLSVFGTLNGSILSSPRVFFAMAEDGLFFRTVGRVHPKYETPVAIAFIVVIAVVYVLLRDFMQLAEAIGTACGRSSPCARSACSCCAAAGPASARLPRSAIGRARAVRARDVRRPRQFAVRAVSGRRSRGIAITLAGVPLYFAWGWWQQRR
ncbi:MAG: hypothetical protein U1F23_12400 [Lysobacterales bacterium]